MTGDVQIIESFWGRGYKGTKDALIGTGLFRAEWFVPIEPIEGARSRRTTHVKADHREITITRETKHRFYAQYCYTAEEREEYESIEKLRECAKRFQGAVACLPTSENEFREHHARNIEREWSLFVKFAWPGAQFSGGFDFDEDSREEIEGAFAELIGTIRDARVVFSDRERAKCLEALRAEYMGGAPDSGSAKFLRVIHSLAANDATPPETGA